MTINSLRERVEQELVSRYKQEQAFLHEGTPLPKTRAAQTYEEHMGERFTPADELIKLRDAGLLTDAEARLVVVDMFPQIKRLEDARRLVSEADAE